MDDWADETKRSQALPALLRWASVESEVCLAWIQSLPASVKSILSGEIAGSLMAVDPELAVRFTEEMTPGQTSDEMLRQAGMEMATRSPERALEWATSQTDGSVRDILLSAVDLVMASSDPRQAAEQARAIVNDDLRLKVQVEISQRWAQQDLRSASEYVMTLPVASAVPAAMQVVAFWPASDLKGCVAWIGGLPQEGKKQALEALISRPSFKDPAMLEELLRATSETEFVALIREKLESK